LQAAAITTTLLQRQAFPTEKVRFFLAFFDLKKKAKHVKKTEFQNLASKNKV